MYRFPPYIHPFFRRFSWEDLTVLELGPPPDLHLWKTASFEVRRQFTGLSAVRVSVCVSVCLSPIRYRCPSKFSDHRMTKCEKRTETVLYLASGRRYRDRSQRSDNYYPTLSHRSATRGGELSGPSLRY